MTRILAVYGTAYGQTERVVRRIADRLTANGLDIAVHRGDALPPDLDLDRFDGFVVAASVMRGNHQACIHDFVARHVSRLNTSPSAFVSVSGAAGSPLPGKRVEALAYVDTFLAKLGWQPALTTTVGGALAYTKYGFVLRWIMKRISRQAGGPTDTSRDHDTADWDAVDRFAERCAAAFAQPALP